MPKMRILALVAGAILLGSGGVHAAGNNAFSPRTDRPFVLAQNRNDVGARLERCLQHCFDQRDRCLNTNVDPRACSDALRRCGHICNDDTKH